jgi:ABC-type transporter Mla maintaining outer membrane lipid asymmetry ATPase subunit MlaF
MADKDAHITVKDLTLAYGRYVVQQHLNFTINRGEVFIIMGGSGCGKSTIMYGLTGLKEPASGRVLYDGVSFWESEPEEKDTGRDAARETFLTRVGENATVFFQSAADKTYKGLVLTQSRTVEKLSRDIAAGIKKTFANSSKQ